MIRARISQTQKEFKEVQIKQKVSSLDQFGLGGIIENEMQFGEKIYENNKKDIEMSVNTWSIGSFFLGDIELMDNENVLIEFGKALIYFWKKRVDELFPNRNIIVETGMELFGEFGLSITLYEEEK